MHYTPEARSELSLRRPRGKIEGMNSFNRRALMAALPASAIACLGVAPASAVSVQGNRFGKDNDQYLESHPDLKGIVEQYALAHDDTEVAEAITFYRQTETGYSDGEPTITPMGGCVSIPKGAAVAAAWIVKGSGMSLKTAAMTLGITMGPAGIGLSVGIGAWGLGAHWTGDQFLDWIDRQSWPRDICV